MFKFFIIFVLLVIIVSLFSALRTLVRNKDGDKQKTVRFLAVRVGFSVLLLILLGIAMLMGWINPHGLPAAPDSNAAVEQSQIR
ncbi:MAG: DUF2909 domain-containing protein [Gammaproteobacteria bacterium]